MPARAQDASNGSTHSAVATAASAAASITGDESSQGGYALPIHDHQLESLAKQIATLEMKELNEKQRADHSDNKCKLLQVRKQKGTFEHLKCELYIFTYVFAMILCFQNCSDLL